MKYILGIDPGLSGGLAFLREDGQLTVIGMPTEARRGAGGSKRRQLDMERLRQHFDRDDLLHVVIERQGTRPGEAPGRVMTTGTNFGILIGLTAANYHAHSIVMPQVWKRALAVPREKDKAMARASELMPRAAHRWAAAGADGRAEAALIALYGARQVLDLSIPAIWTE